MDNTIDLCTSWILFNQFSVLHNSFDENNFDLKFLKWEWSYSHSIHFHHEFGQISGIIDAKMNTTFMSNVQSLQCSIESPTTGMFFLIKRKK